jgi:hypothetical protein
VGFCPDPSYQKFHNRIIRLVIQGQLKHTERTEHHYGACVVALPHKSSDGSIEEASVRLNRIFAACGTLHEFVKEISKRACRRSQRFGSGI